MSIDQQPAQTDYDPNSRGSGRGERFAVVVGVVVTVLAVAGIGVIVAGGDERPSVLPSAAPSIAPSVAPPSAVPVVQTPEDLAAAAAETRYREYLRVDDEVGQGGYTSTDPYDAVSVVPERANLELVFRAARKTPGRRQIGTTEVAALGVTSVKLDATPGDYPKIVLQACVDVSGVDVLDGTGRSIVTADRVQRSKSTVTMYRYEPGTKGAELGGWYVYEATSTGEPC